MVAARTLVNEGARRHGERPAVVSSAGRMSYADLGVRSDRLAAALAARGVAPGARVVVFMDDSIEAVVAIFGVLRAGAVLVPVGSTACAADLAAVFDDCRAAAVITQTRLAARAAEAMRAAPCVRLAVLAGGDQGSISETCLCFEGVTGRAQPALAEPRAPEFDPLMLVYPRTPAGFVSPVTMTEADLSLDPCGGYAAVGAVVDDVRPMAGMRGISRLLAAVAAGATIVLGAARGSASRRAVQASAA